jgi:hypothetical protein
MGYKEKRAEHFVSSGQTVLVCAAQFPGSSFVNCDSVSALNSPLGFQRVPATPNFMPIMQFAANWNPVWNLSSVCDKVTSSDATRQ